MPPRSTSISMRLRAGVEGVLDQLLDDRGGALDHLAGGDLVDEFAGKDTDGHGVQVYTATVTLRRAARARDCQRCGAGGGFLGGAREGAAALLLEARAVRAD